MSELDNLYNQRSSYESQKRQCEENRTAISNKIQRLEKAKSKIVTVKKDASTARDYIKGKLETHTDSWVGSVYNDVNEIHQDDVNAKFNTYYDDVDYVLDEICNEITRLENENRNLGVVLNGIVNAINNICNEIEKWLN